MKKIASIILCALFLYNIMGYYTAFLIKHTQLKNEMKAFIKSDACKENLQKLMIPAEKYAASVDFIEENEFFYKGELYDLVKKETYAAYVILYCINDQKEEQLLETAHEYFNSNHDQNNSTNKNSTVLDNIIKEALSEKPHSMNLSHTKTICNSDELSQIINQYIAIISPPPKA